MEQNRKQLILQAVDALADIYTELMEEYWENEEVWNKVAEIRQHVLIARERTASLP